MSNPGATCRRTLAVSTSSVASSLVQLASSPPLSAGSSPGQCQRRYSIGTMDRLRLFRDGVRVPSNASAYRSAPQCGVDQTSLNVRPALPGSGVCRRCSSRSTETGPIPEEFTANTAVVASVLAGFNPVSVCVVAALRSSPLELRYPSVGVVGPVDAVVGRVVTGRWGAVPGQDAMSWCARLLRPSSP